MGIFDIFRKKASLPSEITLHGKWILVRAEGDLETGDGVQMEFQPNGNLIYTIRSGEKAQIMKMVYRVEGNQLISNQPSVPREEKTTFTFEDGLLVLDFAGTRSWFNREAGK
ncbi:MAG: hypothetical protein HY343_05560 [Lentisphaerae bacterium]|nr:hypothetical protein [Lentisphaerota bacterium]